MNELAKLEALAQHTGLLTWDGDKGPEPENLEKFTRQAAFELREQGFGNIRDEGAENVDAVLINTIMNRNTGEVFEVVADAGAERQRVAFAQVDNLDDDLFVEPEDQFQQEREEADSPAAAAAPTSDKARRKHDRKRGSAKPRKRG